MTSATLADARASAAARDVAPRAPGAEPWVLWAVLLASTCIATGLIWDISWHMTIGRDTLWSPPHVLEQVGASLAGLSCGAYVVWLTFRGGAAARARTVGFWGFRGPFGAWVCIWGALTMIASVPFDDWWHNAYGLDVQILSPPHTVLLAGMLGIQVGAMFFTLAAQNRLRSTAGAGARALRRYGWMFAFSAGVLVTMGWIAFAESIAWPNEWHSSQFYRTTALVFPLLLAGAARAGSLRYPATAAAAAYLALVCIMNWTLQLFEARPLLAPIYNPVDHMVPLGFPLLLVAPAFAIDLLLGSFRGRSDWLLAGAIGVAFVGVLLLVHWPFGEFMLTPAARNPIFHADRWPYTSLLGDWRYEFWNLDRAADGSWSAALFAQRIGIAMLFAIVSARAGLAWGGWMRKVMR